MRSHSPNTYGHNKKSGVIPRKGANFEQKREIRAVFDTGEKIPLDRRYQKGSSRSLTAFIERAVDFYLDYLSANDAGLFLPTTSASAGY